MPAWESLVRLTYADSWGTPGTFGKRGYFLYADSEDLDYGAQVTERDSKLLGVRESPVDTFSVDRYFPQGQMTIQPRVDDMLYLLMAHFQNVIISPGGTYQFFRAPNPISWTQGGSVFCVGSATGGTAGTVGTGRNPYSVNVDVFFGQSFVTANGTSANGIRFTNGIVDKLTISNKYGEDLQVTPEFKFLNGSYYSYPTNFASPSVYGSLSAYPRFVDYQGTVTVGSEDYDVDGIELNFSNNSTDKARIGKRGYNRFPFSGRYMAEGNMDMELSRDLAVIAEGVYTAVTVDFMASAANRIKTYLPNVANRAFSVPLSGGDSLIELSKGFRAYPPSGGTTGASLSSHIVTVYTGTLFGTGVFGF